MASSALAVRSSTRVLILDPSKNQIAEKKYQSNLNKTLKYSGAQLHVQLMSWKTISNDPSFKKAKAATKANVTS